MGRVVELRAGAREPQVGDRLAWDGLGWVPEVNVARPRGVTHVHSETIVRVVMGKWRSPDFVSGSSGWQFDADGSLEANNITARGTIYAEAGEIAGWTLAVGHLYAGTGATRVGLKPGSYPFYAGSEAEASAPFRVNTGGEMWATDAHIAGEITATTGTIGGWTITATEIKSGGNIVLDSSVPKLEIGESGYIQSSNYVSGFDGFHVDGDFAEFGNVQVRGSLHCAVFVKDLISAHAGTLLVTKSAGRLTSDYVTTSTMVVETPPGGGWLFDSGDIVRLKETYASGVHESWVTVTRTATINQYTTAFSSGDSTTYHKGVTAVDYGQSGDGGILQTADMANAPWLSVFTHAGAPWTTLTQHLRLGNLKGTADFSADAYGIFIGDYAGNKWMSYDPTNSLRIRGDAIIDGTIQATMFTNDIGALMFSKADGLLLLGPNCEINATEWWSLRRQKATITGAFHQEAGRWLGTRGLVVEGATTNLITNPSVETNATGWALRGGATVSRDTTYSRFGGYSLKNVAPTEYDGCVYTPDIAVDASSTYTLSMWLYTTEATSMFLRATLDNSGNHTNYFTSSGQGWERVALQVDTNASDTLATECLIVTGAGVSTTFFWIDGVQFEKKGQATTYCDGAQGHEYTWDGTAHASTSQRAQTLVSVVPQGLVDLTTGSLSIWFQMPHDAGTSGLSTTRGLFRWWDAFNTESLYVTFTSDLALVYLVAYAGSVQQCYISASLAGSKQGDWHHVAMTWDTTNGAKIYLDGVLKNSDATFTAPAIVSTTAYVGYVSARFGGVVAEFASFGTELSATEVAAMYALQRPLVDAGAMDRPGVYILDGKFKMASSLTGNRIEMTAEEIAGYNSSGTKQFYLRASDGAAMAGAGAIILNSLGKETHGTGDADIYDKWYNADITVYSDAFGFANLQKTDPDSHTYGVMNFGVRHNATNQSNVACWLNQVDLVVQKAGGWRHLLQANYDFVKVEGVPFRVAVLAADPTVGIVDGMLYYRTSDYKLRLRANGAWVNLN